MPKPILNVSDQLPSPFFCATSRPAARPRIRIFFFFLLLPFQMRWKASPVFLKRSMTSPKKNFLLGTTVKMHVFVITYQILLGVQCSSSLKMYVYYMTILGICTSTVLFVQGCIMWQNITEMFSYLISCHKNASYKTHAKISYSQPFCVKC